MFQNKGKAREGGAPRLAVSVDSLCDVCEVPERRARLGRGGGEGCGGCGLGRGEGRQGGGDDRGCRSQCGGGEQGAGRGVRIMLWVPPSLPFFLFFDLSCLSSFFCLPHSGGGGTWSRSWAQTARFVAASAPNPRRSRPRPPTEILSRGWEGEEGALDPPPTSFWSDPWGGGPLLLLLDLSKAQKHP